MIYLNDRRYFVIMVVALTLFLADFSLVFAEEFRYDSHGKRDPFLSPANQLTEKSNFSNRDLRLEGIIADQKGKSYAIVNGEIVGEGQVFQGFLLKTITSEKVVFEKDKESFAIPLRSEDELTKASPNKKIENKI